MNISMKMGIVYGRWAYRYFIQRNVTFYTKTTCLSVLIKMPFYTKESASDHTGIW